MHFIGLDLAWGNRRPTGIAVLDDDGQLLHIGAAHDDADILAKLRPYVDHCLVAIDAPLVVTNPHGNRGCEAELNRDFRAFDAGTHPTNTSRPWFANGSRGARIAAALGLDLDPRSASFRRTIEVYPHAATVVLFSLDRTLKYKQKKGRNLEQLKTELLRLMDLIEGLRHADPRLHITKTAAWMDIRRAVESATRKFELRRAEDPVDAVVCAYVALYAARRPADVTLYGDAIAGCIVTPTMRPSPAGPPGASGR